MLALIFSCALALVIAWITRWIYRWYHPACNGKLPPGSMGLPLFGETLQFIFLNPQKTFDIPPFIRSRMKRYGSVFKTNLLGQNAIVCTDPGLCRYIFLQDGNSVEMGYMGSYKELTGESIWSNSSGALHKYLKGMFNDHYSPLKQKDLILSEMGEIVHKHFGTWSKQESIELKEVTNAMSFEISLGRLLSRDAPKHLDVLKDKYKSIFKGLSSWPLDVPGFHFHKCLQDKRQALGIYKEIMKERLYSTEKHADFLDAVIGDIRKENPVFNMDSAAHFIFGILFASYGSLSMTIVMAIKFISEHPLVMKDLKDEHETILRNKPDPDSPLTWKDYTSMTFTSHVIDETLRLSSIAFILIRRAIKDIHTDDGYVIPAGWLILLSPPALHFNTEKYQDPLAFNPWRWKWLHATRLSPSQFPSYDELMNFMVGQGSSLASKDFGAFAGGLRQCPGAEYVRLQMSVVIHFFITKYRFTKIKGGEVEWNPILTLPNGFHFKVTNKL